MPNHIPDHIANSPVETPCDIDHDCCPGLSAHCRVGEHCPVTDATCAVDITHDDHPFECCFCQRGLHR